MSDEAQIAKDAALGANLRRLVDSSDRYVSIQRGDGTDGNPYEVQTAKWLDCSLDEDATLEMENTIDAALAAAVAKLDC